ncbi:MAG TPA: hypothetical protein VKT72_04520 [Candidatus Baltobacteraceae bacterium]|nr:hypothetical protein [Candidatus Baltobacteraceae bacterium]
MNLLRAFAFCGVSAATVVAAACSGSGPSSPSALPQLGPTSAPTASDSHTVSGEVDYATYYSSEHEFQVKASSGKTYWILTTSKTQWTGDGLALKVGDWISATGNWKTSDTLDASSISLNSSPQTTPAPTASASAAPAGGAPAHVQTGEYLLSSTEMTTNPSVYAPYLSWAYTVGGRAGITQAAGIKIVLYTDPIMPERGSYEYDTLNGSYQSARATTCSGSLVTTFNGTGLLSDPTKSAATPYFQSVMNNAVTTVEKANPGYAHPWDLIYVDDDGPLYGASATPCNFSPTTWGIAQDTALATTGQKFILNSLSVADSNVPTYVQRLAGSAIAGGEFEECFMTALWSSEEDAQLEAIALLKREGKAGGAGFWCYADNTTALAASSIAQRLYIYASFLLTYDPNYSVFQESFTTPSTFKVFPETGLVPMNPITTPTSVSGLATSTGAYMREYDACYYRGSYVGKCEIVVNPSTTSAVNVPNPWRLHHSMTLSGGGVLDGGTAWFADAAPAMMAPKSGLILTP